MDSETYEVDGKTVHDIVSTIYEAVKGNSQIAVYMACITVALMIQDEKMRDKELRDGVMATSEWMMGYLSKSTMNATLPREKMD